MNHIEETIRNVPLIESRIGYVFKDKSILLLAFAHRSFAHEMRQVSQHNERLEFLGDSILGFLVAKYLYEKLPNIPEGELSVLRSRLVESTSCVAYIKELNIGQFILLGRGERLNDGKGRETILADLFEAIIAAIYLDGGIEATERFLFGHFEKNILEIIKNPSQNWKALLQDYCQKHHQQTPQYIVISEQGPDHCKEYVVAVSIQNKELGRGVGFSKKAAQQQAAENAYTQLNPS